MSLRLRINLVVTLVTVAFTLAMVYEMVNDLRSSVREEIESTTRVAVQLVETVVAGVYLELRSHAAHRRAARLAAPRRTGARQRHPLLRWRRGAALRVAGADLSVGQAGAGVVQRSGAPGSRRGAVQPAGRVDRGDAGRVALDRRGLGRSAELRAARARLPGARERCGLLAAQPRAQAAAEDSGWPGGAHARPLPRASARVSSRRVRRDQPRLQSHGAGARGEPGAEPPARAGGAAVERCADHQRSLGADHVLQRGRGAAARLRAARARRQPGRAGAQEGYDELRKATRADRAARADGAAESSA